jgi:hypothetical protein
LNRVLLVLVTSATAVAASPAQSQAAVTIGNDLTGSNNGPVFGCGVPCTAFQTAQAGANLPLTSPVDGVITSWSYRSADAAAVYALRVLHPVGAQYKGAGTSATVTVPNPTTDSVKGPLATTLPIRASDRIGLQVRSSPAGGAPVHLTTNSGDVVAGFTAPDLADGSTRTPSSTSSTQQLLVQATIQQSPLSSASIPACSNGQIPVTVSDVGGPGPASVHFRLDGGAETVLPTDAAGVATVNVPQGQHTLEYWGQNKAGVQEVVHHTSSFLVDNPTVSITSDQGKTLYVTGERASVTVVASDPLNGLASDPSQRGLVIPTNNASALSISRTATNRCGNSTTATFSYLVLPRPVLGKSVTIGLVSGIVYLRLPAKGTASGHASATRRQKFVPLVGIRGIPVGTTLDSRRGVVRIFTAANASSTRLNTADFTNGIFQSLQSRRLRGLSDINLTGGSFRGCTARAGTHASASRSRRVIRRLRGSGSGRFRTRGRYSAATVRGTIWDTIDRCDGTLTRVTRGVVVVRDFRKRRNITVRAGKSYLARAP